MSDGKNLEILGKPMKNKEKQGKAKEKHGKTRKTFILQAFSKFFVGFSLSNLGIFSFILQGFGIPSFFRRSYDTI